MPDVLMPRLSDTMEEGTLSQWIKHEGDQVRKGDILAVIETDKAAMEMEAYDEGVLTRILVGEGQAAAIGTLIAVIGDEAASPAPSPATSAPRTAMPEGQEPQAPVPQAQVPQAPVPQAPVPQAPVPQAPVPQAPVPQAPVPEGPAAAAPSAAAPEPGLAGQPAQPPGARPAGQARTSPLARSLARRHGVDLAAIDGTGPGGRIVRADVEDAVRNLGASRQSPAAGPGAVAASAPGPVAAAAPAAPVTVAADEEEIPLSAVRRITAQRLVESVREAPHFYLTVEAGADDLLAFRADVNQQAPADVKISVTDLLVKACATALAAHPEANVSWAGDRILRHRHINVGIAVAIDDGLVVPVIRDADRKTLTEVAREAHSLTDKARARRLALDDYAGGTFTVSNLGMYGIRQFTAVINPPQAAILAVGAAIRQPVVRADQVAIASTMALTLSIDHRVLDGASGAVFLADIRKLIEHPVLIVL